MESREPRRDSPDSAVTPLSTSAAGQKLAGKDSPLNQLLRIAQNVNDTAQTGIDTTFHIAAHSVSDKGELLAYVSQLICWDLDTRVLPEGESCVVAAALIHDHGPRFVVGVNARNELSYLHEALQRTLPRAIAGVPVDDVIEKDVYGLEARVQKKTEQDFPLPDDCTAFSFHAQQKIVAYIRAVYGRAARRTMGAIGIAHVHSPCTPSTAGTGVNHRYAYFARTYFKAIASRENAALNIQPFWYKHGQRPPRGDVLTGVSHRSRHRV